MFAQIINETGDPSVFQFTEVEQPACQAGHLLVKVAATSVNQIDAKIRSGAVTNIAPELPAILHSDVAGVVEEVGDGVSGFNVGDEVYGCAGGMKGTVSGALAEYMVVDADLVAHKPKGVSMQTAAALPLVAITAWTALFKKLDLQPGQTILIHGGVGGVGHIATQLAAHHGATVYVTVGSDEDAALAKELGATDSANFKSETAEEYVQRLTDGVGFDVIFDTVGGPNLENSFKAIAMNGKIATTAARVTMDLSLLHNKAADLMVVFMLLPLIQNKHRKGHQEILEALAALVAEGTVTPIIDPNQFNLKQTSEAHAHLESGKARGKVVISIGEGN